jgi:hypothetical protein
MIVNVLVRRKLNVCRILPLGWICLSCGLGLLMFMEHDKSVPADVLLSLPSGIGVGILLPALNIGAKQIASRREGVQAQTLLLSLRYLGSTLGLIAVGIIFKSILKHNLMSTKFASVANEMTKHATTLVYSVHKFANPNDVYILITATEKTLRTTWMILAFTCLAMVLVTAVTASISTSPNSAAAEN